jgi:hypothetical protein
MNARVLVSCIVIALAGSACGLGDSQRHLRTGVDAQGDALSSCYAGALARNPAAAGTVHARLHVDGADGQLRQVEIVRSDISDDAFHGCFTEALQQVRLSEAPPANLDVEYTFELAPAG